MGRMVGPQYHSSGPGDGLGRRSDLFPGAPPGLGMGAGPRQPKGLWSWGDYSRICIPYGRALWYPRKGVPMDRQLVLGAPFRAAAAGVGLSYSLFFL
jgi:hypothetical protein